MTARPLLIAIDGTASSGKGTLARRLGEHYGLPHLDTGLLYRAVGQRMADEGADLADPARAETVARAFEASWLGDPRLRTAEAGVAASKVASVPGVRAALRAFQQRFAAQADGAVLDGRDIGTVIAPGADVKIWITASPQVRAHRRWRELSTRGADVSEATILAELDARDARDAPNMVRAPDAHLLDTSDLAIDAVFHAALRIVEGQR